MMFSEVHVHFCRLDSTILRLHFASSAAHIELGQLVQAAMMGVSLVTSSGPLWFCLPSSGLQTPEVVLSARPLL